MVDSGDQMLFATFNQDSSCFAIGTEKGFRIYNSYPFKDNFKRNLQGGIGIIEMLDRCNILALVGGGKNPKYAPNKVILWDDAQEKVISELRFTSYIKNIKLKRNKIFIVCQIKIYVFTFENFTNIDTITTHDNPKGIIGISQSGNNNIIAYPDPKSGSVTIKNYDNQATTTISAHQSPIACLSMNRDGSLLATASVKGTLIRIYRTSDSMLIQELRRGSEKAEIYSIAFDINSKYLACSSDRGTIHIFVLKNEENNNNNEERKENLKSAIGSFLSFFNVKNEYLNSEWSFAQFKIPSTKAIVAFASDNTIIVITAEGKYFQANFDTKVGGNCTKLQEKNIMSAEEF
jgi:WD40 repeat protein